MDTRTYPGLTRVWRYGAAAAFCALLLWMTVPLLTLAQFQGTFDWRHIDPLSKPAIFIGDPLLFLAVAYNTAAYRSLPKFYRYPWLGIKAQVLYVAIGWALIVAYEWVGNWKLGHRFGSWHEGFATLYPWSDRWHALASGPLAGVIGLNLMVSIYATLVYRTHRTSLWVTGAAMCVWIATLPFSTR